MPTIVPAYAGLFAIVFAALAFRVIRMRQATRIGIGAGGNAVLERTMRVHANFAEYVPFALLLLTFIEWQTQPKWLVHALCLILLAARLVHAYGVSQPNENIAFRATGVTATLAVMIVAAVMLIGRAF